MTHLSLFLLFFCHTFHGYVFYYIVRYSFVRWGATIPVSAVC